MDIMIMNGNETLQQSFGDMSASANVDIAGRRVKFFCPNNGYTKEMVINILKGNEYPIFCLPGYYPKNIIDIGANIGATALYFSAIFPNSRIYCYEPANRNFLFLQKNTKELHNIIIYSYGLYDESCEVSLFYGKDSSAQDSIIRNFDSTEKGETVSLVQVSEEMARLGIIDISILKVDTEGCEIPILTEFQKMKDLNIDIIYVEYHSEDDRLVIDRLLSENFNLFFSSSTLIHRGTNAYICKKLTEKYPRFGLLEINR